MAGPRGRGGEPNADADPVIRPRIDLRLVPAAAAAWLGMWVATAGEPRWLILGAAFAAGLGAWGRRRRSWRYGAVALVVAGCMLVGWARWWWQQQDQLVTLADAQAVGVAELVVTGMPRTGQAEGVRPAWWLSAARLERIEARGQQFTSGALVRVSASGDAMAHWSALTPGTRVRATVRLSPAEPGDTVVVGVRAREPPVIVAPPGWADEAVERVRAGLRASVSGLDAEPRALVPALVVGDVSRMPEDLTERFRITGLTHLTAVSGANLTLLLAFLGTMARWCGLTGWWLRGLLGVGVVGFVLLCHSEPSVVRAAAMGVVGLVALGAAGAGGQAVRALCVAVIVIVFVEPVMARSAGFALSVLASAGIVAWSRAWTDLLARRMPRALAEGLATPLAAQLATQPLVTWLSGQVSLAGLAANLVAGPLVGPATVLGFLAAALALPLPWLAELFGAAAGWCAQGLCWIARLGELFPGAALPWPTGPPGVLVVLAGCLGLVLVMPRLLRNPWLSAGVAAGLVAVLLRPPLPPGWPPGQWAVAFCDVGQGDATVLWAGHGSAVVVDTGPDPAALRRCLTGLGVARVPLVALTHFHADHVTGTPAAISSDVPTVVVASAAKTPVQGRALAEQAAPGGLREVATGSRIQVGEVLLEVVAVRSAGVPTEADDHPPSGRDEGESAGENDGSLVLRATVGGLRVLLPGDVQTDGQRHALTVGADLSADVLLVPHHGSSDQLPEFLAATRARIAVFSAGVDNDYGHPAVSTQRAVHQLGMRVVRTDTQGSIAIGRAGETFTVTTQR